MASYQQLPSELNINIITDDDAFAAITVLPVDYSPPEKLLVVG